MGTPGTQFDWLRELQETLWQVRMVAKDASGLDAFLSGLHDAVAKLRAFSDGISGVSGALSRLVSSIADGSFQRGLGRSIRSGGGILRSIGRIARSASGNQGVGGAVGRGFLRAGHAVTTVGRAAAGLGAGTTLGVLAGGTAVIGGAALVMKEGLARAREIADRQRHQTTFASGVDTRAAILQTKLRGELEKQQVQDIYAIEQKRAEQAFALHQMKATNVASELKYQKEIFAVDKRRYENEKKIHSLKMAVQQQQQRTQNALDEANKVREAKAGATIKRTWWRPDETVDANGNVISNSLAKAAGLRTFHTKETVNANFAVLKELANNVGQTMMESFKEGADLFATKVSAVFDKASSLSVGAMSDETEKKINGFRYRLENFESHRMSSMNTLNYDKLMKGEIKPQSDGNGNVVFVDERGEFTAESESAYRARVRAYNKESHPEVEAVKKQQHDLEKEAAVLNAELEMRGHVQGIADERIKQEAESRKKISEEYREKYISNTAETVSQFGASTASLERQASTRANDLHQKYALELVRGDAEATQKMRENFALTNAEKEVRDKSAEKFESEQRELASKKIVEAGRLWIRSAERALQASLGIKEAQAELARKINQFQLDVELANADTYGKTIWETQKATDRANFGVQHADKLRNINERYINRERDEENKIDKQKRAALDRLDKNQLNERMALEKKLIDAQLEYRKAEIRFEYEYREQMEKAYNERRANDRRSWLQGVTKEEVKELIGVDKDVKDLTLEEQDRLAQSRKAKAEHLDDTEDWKKEFGASGQSDTDFMNTLDKELQKYDSLDIDNLQESINKKREDTLYDLKKRDERSVLQDMVKEGIVKQEDLDEALDVYDGDAYYAAGRLGTDVMSEWSRRLEEQKEQLEEKRREEANKTVADYVKQNVGDLVVYNAETNDVVRNEAKYSNAKQYKDALQWKQDHADEIKTARERAAFNAKEFETRRAAIEENAAKEAGFDQVRDQRVDAARELEEMKAKQTVAREKEEAKFERRRKRKEGQRKIDKENDVAQEDLEHTKAERYNDIFLENRARNDKFIAQQADIYNRGQIAQRNLATDNLVTAMQQNGGGYTNQMIKYGIQSEYESAKNEMEARHAAEKEQLESRGNVTEYERQELQNRQAMEASDLDNNKKLRDMMADRVMNANVGQKSGMAETWERIQASAFGHMKDPVEMAIDSLKENDSKNHDDLMSRLDQYLPAIAQNTAETDAAAISNVTNYMSRPNDNPGLLSGMPNVRLA